VILGNWVVSEITIYTSGYDDLIEKKTSIDSAFFEHALGMYKYELHDPVLYFFDKDSMGVSSCSSSSTYLCRVLLGNDYTIIEDSIKIRDPQLRDSVDFQMRIIDRDHIELTSLNVYDGGRSELVLTRTKKGKSLVSSENVMAFLTRSKVIISGDINPATFLPINWYGHIKRDYPNLAEEEEKFTVVSMGDQCYLVIEDTVYQIISLTGNVLKTYNLSSDFKEITFESVR
jgi:hypothetical protein